MKRPGCAATIWRTSSFGTLPSTPANRPTTTPASTPAASPQQQVHGLLLRGGEGVKPTVRVKPSRRAPAEYISVSRKPPTGGLRRKSMIIAVSSLSMC